MGVVYTVRYYYEKASGVFSNGDNKITEVETNVVDPEALRPSTEEPTINYYKRVIVAAVGEKETENAQGTSTDHPNGIKFVVYASASGNSRNNYAAKGFFHFRGTDKYPQIQQCAAILTCRVQNNGQGKARIFDVTNGNVICELTGITNTDQEGLDMGTISNLPSGPADFEIQVGSDNNRRTYPVHFQLVCNEH